MLFKIAFLLFMAFAFEQVTAEEEKVACITYYNETAYCVDLRDCIVLKQIWESGTIRQKQSDYFLNSLCGEKNGRIQICCANRFQKDPIDPRDLLPKPPDCGVSEFTNRLIPTKETSLKQYPWSVILINRNKQSQKDEITCGGALINNRYVLTTAHCAYKPGLERVRLGDWDITTNPDCAYERGQRTCAGEYVVEGIADINVHPLYDETRKHDIALLRLRKKLAYKKGIKPACLPLENWLSNNQLVDETVAVVGWGLSENGAANSRKIKTDSLVQNLHDCASNHSELSASQLCVGQGKGCQGDVGGPLMYLDTHSKDKVNYVVGLSSYGNENCTQPNSSTVYTRVGAYIDWILAVIEP